jgi:hypothetical protein
LVSVEAPHSTKRGIAVRFVPMWVFSKAIAVQKFPIDGKDDDEGKEQRDGEELGSEGEETEKLDELSQSLYDTPQQQTHGICIKPSRG